MLCGMGLKVESQSSPILKALLHPPDCLLSRAIVKMSRLNIFLRLSDPLARTGRAF